MKDSGGTLDGAGRDVILACDLDGTLCRTDTLHEALLALVSQRPWALLGLPIWLAAGKAGFKSRVADAVVIPGNALPLNEDVVAELRAARASGRRTVLVTASDRRQAEAVAAATGLFDEVHGTGGGQNLKGAGKARFLADRFGVGGYDYLGDATVDAPVWQGARQAITVGAGAHVRRVAEAANPSVRHLSPPGSQVAAMLRAMRPHQWSKNLLLFVPTLAAHDMEALGQVILGFLAFCLTASAVYVLNDLFDLQADRAHPRKRRRPFAAGTLSAATGVGMSAGLLAMATILGLATGNPLFLGMLALYLVATFAYSLWLKRKLLVDVLMLAGLYTVRIIAGGVAAGIVLSPWLLGLSMFLFLSLAAVKRQAELMDQLATGRDSAGRAYTVEDLPILRGMAMASCHAAVMVLALYLSSDAVQALYARPWLLWLACPLLLYWSLRMVMKAHRGLMTDDPIVFAARDPVSLAVTALTMLVAVAAAQ
ncbi:MAG: UbiA family prenyltransferase [Rhodobacteraceae bacterium]|jgi:4-hydroxybenzoate polyprenyltransferase|nr:UbiA family prenyltransferase [Paracoccaceae bacterium]